MTTRPSPNAQGEKATSVAADEALSDVLRVGARLAHLQGDERLPDDVSNLLRSYAMRLKTAYDSQFLVEREGSITRSRRACCGAVRHG